MSKKRIIGLDVARALAVIGMIIVNFKVVFGDEGANWLATAASVFDGKAAATFVVLAGVGLALITKSAVEAQDITKLQQSQKKILKRSIFLFIIGLSYMPIWPADILHFYGVYMLFTIPFLGRAPKLLLWLAGILIILSPLLMIFFDYEKGWDFESLTYLDFWQWKGFLRNLFFNGFHPVIPWAGFMLFGAWLGHQPLDDPKWIKVALRWSTIVFITVQVTSWYLLDALAGSSEDIEYLVSTSPMPPLPLYMVTGLSVATLLISVCILLAKRFAGSSWVVWLQHTGELALTFYVGHVIIGMGAAEVFLGEPLGNQDIHFSIGYALIFSLICVVFANVWKRYRALGPLEWVMRKLVG